MNSGLSKRSASPERAARLAGFAAGAYPQVSKVSPATFTKALSTAEIALGGALLTPFVPTRIAGLGLAAFSTGLLRLYLKTPSLTAEDGIRPSEEGTGIAKDVWMAGIAASLLLDSIGGCRKPKRSKARPGRRSKKRSAKTTARVAGSGAKLAAGAAATKEAAASLGGLSKQA